MKYFSEELTIDEVENLDLDNDLWLDFNCDIDYKIHQEDNSYRYLVCTNAVQIPSLKIDIHYAIGEYLNEESGNWEVDYDTFMFTEADTYNYIYSENSSMSVCIHNYCCMKKITTSCIGDLPCYLLKK